MQSEWSRHVAEMVQAYLGSEHRDDRLLLDYAHRLGNRTVFKRLGFLVEALGDRADAVVSECQRNLSEEPWTSASSLAPRRCATPSSRRTTTATEVRLSYRGPLSPAGDLPACASCAPWGTDACRATPREVRPRACRARLARRGDLTSASDGRGRDPADAAAGTSG
jgi:hypothetical protein